MKQLPPDTLTNVSGANADAEIKSLAYDSRQVTPGTLFFAVPGGQTDGHVFVPQALERGAAAVVSEREADGPLPVPWIQVRNVRPAMAILAHDFCGKPSETLRLIGITGTNGKTTTSYLAHSILSTQAPALLLGTIKTRFGDVEFESKHTTPEAIDLQRVLAEALERGCKHGAMEVSSHALALFRVYGCHFPVAVFTNLTQDHLDFHGTLEEYFRAKLLLFDPSYNRGIQFAVVNADDPFARRIQPPSGVTRVTYGLSEEADVHPARHTTSIQGTRMEIAIHGRRLDIESSLVGQHNIYNLLTAVAATSALGISDVAIQQGISRLSQVSGRFEKVPVDAPFTVIVDYAHTPDALENVLRLSRKLTSSRVICVFGCGGDRDRTKRPIMGALAAKHADVVVVTSDNPRSEEPEAIVNEIVAGIDRSTVECEVVVDRREGIRRALSLAGSGDIVLIAGKGHENYQIVKGVKHHFDDREVVREVL